MFAVSVMEWAWLGIGLVLALVPVALRASDMGPALRRVILGLIAVALVGGLAFWDEFVGYPSDRREAFSMRIPSERTEGGFATSETCRSCHPDAYASWRRTYHRTMTQVADSESVFGDFEGVVLDDGATRYRLARDGDAFWVDVYDAVSLPNGQVQWRGARRQRIGLVTGSHHMQVYWTVDEEGNAQYIFPFAFHLEDQSWRPRESLFLRRPGSSMGTQVWNRSCYRCHSVGGRPRPDLETGVAHTDVAELGIACEACHGPAEAHVEAMRAPVRRYREREAEAGGAAIVNPERLSHSKGSQVCGFCHSVKWFEDGPDLWAEGFAYRPGDDLDATTPVVRPTKVDEQPWIAELLERHPTLFEMQFWPDGVIRVAGREYNGLVESACFQEGELSCMTCHSMHDSDPNDQLRAEAMTDAVCFSCHSEYESPEAIARHTRHTPGGLGSACVDCHMPHTTYGLLKATRSHQIRSPGLKADLAAGRPNACNLCHLDQTIGWAAHWLSEWWGHEAPELGEAETEIAAGVRWSLTGNAVERALVAAAMGRQASRETSQEWHWIPYMAELATDDYPAVRKIAIRGLRLGDDYEGLAPDFMASPLDRDRSLAQILEVWERGQSDGPSPKTLIGEGRQVNREAFKRWLGLRDNRPIYLVE